MEKIKLIECPRDAMQGLPNFIPTADKIQYINTLLKVGFDTIDVGSFVSPRMIPQMSDTPEVLDKIEWENSNSKLLTIIGNKNGAERAAKFEQVHYLGYPFSISETFQLRNTNATIQESVKRVEDIQEICEKSNKTLVIYLSMGFGNPYGDPWSPSLVTEWTQRMIEDFGVKIISLSDTIGSSNESLIKEVFEAILPYVQSTEIGAHLHAKMDDWQSKIEAAYNAGCRRFDGALKGLGGCPYAADSLVGNIPTELMINWMKHKQIDINIDDQNLDFAMKTSQEIFN